MRFVPACRSDFSFIEKTISRRKIMLRNAGERTFNGLGDIIGERVDIFLPAEWANHPKSGGCEPK